MAQSLLTCMAIRFFSFLLHPNRGWQRVSIKVLLGRNIAIFFLIFLLNMFLMGLKLKSGVVYATYNQRIPIKATQHSRQKSLWRIMKKIIWLDFVFSYLCVLSLYLSPIVTMQLHELMSFTESHCYSNTTFFWTSVWFDRLTWRKTTLAWVFAALNCVAVDGSMG